MTDPADRQTSFSDKPTKRIKNITSLAEVVKESVLVRAPETRMVALMPAIKQTSAQAAAKPWTRGQCVASPDYLSAFYGTKQLGET